MRLADCLIKPFQVTNESILLHGDTAVVIGAYGCPTTTSLIWTTGATSV